MAAVTVATPVWTTTAGNKTVTTSPALDDLIVVIAPSTGLAGGTTAVTDDQSGANASSYTQVDVDYTGFSTTGVLTAWVRNKLMTSNASTIFTAAQAASSGGGLAVIRISGMSIVGVGAVRGCGGQSTVASGTPAPVLLGRVGATFSGTQAALTTNVVITAVASGTSGGGTVARSSPAYADVAIAGYTVPGAGFDLCTINSGETASTITWGGAAPSQFASIALELDASVPQYSWLGDTSAINRTMNDLQQGAVGRGATR